MDWFVVACALVFLLGYVLPTALQWVTRRREGEEGKCNQPWAE